LRNEIRDRLLVKHGQQYGASLVAAYDGSYAVAEQRELERFLSSYSGPEVFKWRHYLPMYERHLAHLRGGAVRLMEIGVAGGGSLRMWRWYLGHASHVIGVDIDPACKARAADGITVEIGDQGDPAFWQQFLRDHSPLDAVIDDGSHAAADQITTLTALLPHLRPGGIYLCEDVHGTTNPFARYIDGLARNLDAGSPSGSAPDGLEIRASDFQNAIAAIHRYPFTVVIERTRTPVGTFLAPRIS
jgi:hypothetical protein